MALVLSACGTHGGSNNSGDVNSTTSEYENSQDPEANITLVNPTDTSMLSSNVKAYVDDVRALRDAADEPYKYHEVTSNIEDSSKKYLDTGDPNGYNETRSQTPDRSDKSQGVELKFNVKEGFTADKYEVLVSDNLDFTNPKKPEVTNNRAVVKNLFVNTQYYWKVVADDEESAVFCPRYPSIL